MKQQIIYMIIGNIYYKGSTRIGFTNQIFKHLLAVWMRIALLWKIVGVLLIGLLERCVDQEWINEFYKMVVKKYVPLNSSQLLHLIDW